MATNLNLLPLLLLSPSTTTPIHTQLAAARPCGCAPAPSAAAARRAASLLVARAEGNGNPILNGPINVGDAAGAAAADKAGGAAKPVDRSKGLWTRCDKCGVILYVKHLKEHHHICFGCNYHLKMTSAERIEHLIDPGALLCSVLFLRGRVCTGRGRCVCEEKGAHDLETSADHGTHTHDQNTSSSTTTTTQTGTWRPMDESLSPMDPLEFVDQKAYPDRVRESQEKTGLQDALRTGTGMLHGIPVALGVMEFNFMGGSMGSVVGEKLTRLIEYATQEGLPLIIVSTSGGARMQEGIMSLMQMAKISAALHVHQNEANLLYVSLLTSPTTGGVTASFGMLGDVIIAEPQAIIGFAGRRVIEQTLNEKLPDDFQTAEYLLDKGLLDLVVPRPFLKGALFEIVDFYRAAPYKRRGKIPYGVQRGSYGLTAEEKMRRAWREWSAASDGAAGGPAALLSAPGGGAPSFAALVASFRRVVAAADAAAAGAGADDADVRALVSDASLLPEALEISKGAVIEWMEAQEALLQRQKREEEEAKFVFSVKSK